MPFQTPTFAHVRSYRSHGERRSAASRSVNRANNATIVLLGVAGKGGGLVAGWLRSSVGQPGPQRQVDGGKVVEGGRGRWERPGGRQ